MLTWLIFAGPVTYVLFPNYIHSSSYYLFYYYYLVLAVLKKNYTRLCHCLPQDYMKTIDKLRQRLTPSDNELSKLTDLPSADVVNEKVIASLITALQSDMAGLQFCDILEYLIDSESSLTAIEALRNGTKKIYFVVDLSVRDYMKLTCFKLWFLNKVTQSLTPSMTHS